MGMAGGPSAVRSNRETMRNCKLDIGLRWRCVAVYSALFGALCGGVSARAQAIGKPIPLGKRSGMARSLYPLQRSRSSTDPRREFYQQQSIRLRRRNPNRAAAPYGPFGGLEARLSRFQSGRLLFPRREFDSLLGPMSPERSEAFRTYGGFRKRVARAYKPGDVSDAFQRRRSLIEATSLYAPVQRANLGNASVAGLRSSLDRVPLPMLDLPLPFADGGGPPTLVEALSRNMALSHERKVREAWSSFREGDFRRAAHSFGSAADLSEGDPESRIGQLFCYVSTGSFRTAIAALARLAREEENPFLGDVDVASRYGRRIDVDRLKLRARLQASAGRDNPALIALSTFIFWYLGEPEEARSTASALSSVGVGTIFADWPRRIDEAITAQAEHPDAVP